MKILNAQASRERVALVAGRLTFDLHYGHVPNHRAVAICLGAPTPKPRVFGPAVLPVSFTLRPPARIPVHHA